jgi:hypothetical protein
MDRCPICASQVISKDSQWWECVASRYHYYTWRVAQIRKAKAAWKPTPYTAQVLAAFQPGAREQFLSEHALRHEARA